MKVHHIGYAVPDLGKAQVEFTALGWNVCSPITEDVSRQARIAFMEKDGVTIELVAPMSDGSPVYKMLQKGSGSPYHICYEVDSIEAAEVELKKERFIPFQKAAVAPAIGGRRVEFMYAKQAGIIELVEKNNSQGE